MYRLVLVLLALAAIVVACSSGGTACMDLCDSTMVCTSPYTCVQSRCLIKHPDDSGTPPNCNMTP